MSLNFFSYSLIYLTACHVTETESCFTISVLALQAVAIDTHVHILHRKPLHTGNIRQSHTQCKQSNRDIADCHLVSLCSLSSLPLPTNNATTQTALA